MKIAITGFSSLSSLGSDFSEVSSHYYCPKSFIKKRVIDGQEVWVSEISEDLKKEIMSIQNENSKYKSLDKTVLYALYTSRKAIKQAKWENDIPFGINIGSSRGATELFEKYYQDFLIHKRVSPLSSPTTTLGNISSWVAQDAQNDGPEISHSITCSTSFHSILNGIAWLKSGMVNRFLVGASEAPLTPFTIEQIKAIKIYSQETDEFPSKAMDISKHKNSMVLGEGAGVACLELGEKENALAYITGIGYATEKIKHNTSISTDAECFQKSMKRAIENVEGGIDAIVMHAPGTVLGDQSELRAIQEVFGEDYPMLTTNKWQIGHTFGASGILSLEMAIVMLKTQKFIPIPFGDFGVKKKEFKNILVNSVGFGGNAVSIVVSEK